MPFLVDMGVAEGAGSMASGKAIFLDINGDALPDLLTSDDKGSHTFQLAVGDMTGHPKFAAAAMLSAKTQNTDFVIGQAQVQAMDVNGDGYVDLVNAKKGVYLCNYG